MEIPRALFGHNAVWCRGGLGVWDDERRAFREEVIEAVAALSPGMLRFPGGTRAMRWRFDRAIGATRTPQCDPFRGVLDATTYGLDEGLAFAERVGAEVALVAPWVDGSAQHTAAMIAYTNGDPSIDVPLGVDVHGVDWGNARDWAARRGRAPYHVRFLEIGNEPYLGLRVGPERSCERDAQFRQCERWIAGRAVPTTARAYAEEVVATSRLVRAIDPSIRIGACALGGLFDHEDPETAIGAGDDELGTHDPWNPRVLGLAGHAFDAWVVHPYVIEPTDARLRLGERLRRCVRGLRNLDPSRAIAVTEYGFLLGGDTMMNALATVDVVRVAIEERLAMALRHLLIEDDPSGPFANAAAILGPTRTRTPAWHAMQMLASLRGHAVELAVEGAHAIVARDGERVCLVLYRLDRGEPRAIEVLGSYEGTVTTLSAPSLESREASRTEQPVTCDRTLRTVLPAATLRVFVLRERRG